MPPASSIRTGRSWSSDANAFRSSSSVQDGKARSVAVLTEVELFEFVVLFFSVVFIVDFFSLTIPFRFPKVQSQLVFRRLALADDFN